jgi:DnaJ-class molecular chaperone
MEIVDYYYKILNLNLDASIEDVYNAYNSKIEKYRNQQSLNPTQQVEVKELKKAKFILSNSQYRNVYDKIIKKKTEENIKMKDLEKTNSKKERLNTQLVGERIFSMVGLHSTPNKDFNMDRKFFTTDSFNENGNKIKSVNEDTNNYGSFD